MSYERIDSPKDPLAMAEAAIGRAADEVTDICLGPLDALDRAALDRAKQDLKAAIARIEDVERATRPAVTYPHPGGSAPLRSRTEVT